MDHPDDWCQRISETITDGAPQNGTTDKTLALIEQQRDSVSDGEQTLFSHVMSELSSNIHSVYQPTEAGLDKCLVTLRNAMASRRESDSRIAQSNDVHVLLFYGMLIATIEKLKEQIA